MPLNSVNDLWEIFHNSFIRERCIYNTYFKVWIWNDDKIIVILISIYLLEIIFYQAFGYLNIKDFYFKPQTSWCRWFYHLCCILFNCCHLNGLLNIGLSWQGWCIVSCMLSPLAGISWFVVCFYGVNPFACRITRMLRVPPR